MNGVITFLAIAGSISLLYFIICICCAGIGSSFSFVWLALSCVCFLGSAGLRYFSIHGIGIPLGIRITVLSLVAVVLAVFVSVEVPILIGSHEKPGDHIEYLIVLGARIDGTRVSRALGSRLESAYDYLEAHNDTKVIVSGGQGSDELITEAEAMEQYLIEKGIKKDRIIKEECSTNTDENIAFSRQLINDDDAEIAIVTNSFHLYRAMRIGKKQGLSRVTGIAAPTDPFLAVNYYVREGLAVLSYKFKGRI